jgi:hypothetical protein
MNSRPISSDFPGKTGGINVEEISWRNNQDEREKAWREARRPKMGVVPV